MRHAPHAHDHFVALCGIGWLLPGRAAFTDVSGSIVCAGRITRHSDNAAPCVHSSRGTTGLSTSGRPFEQRRPDPAQKAVRGHSTISPLWAASGETAACGKTDSGSPLTSGWLKLTGPNLLGPDFSVSAL